MIVTNRYDNLMKKQKHYRNLIENRNTNADIKIKELQTKIAKIRYERDVYCKNINNKLTDVTSLVDNERARILADQKGE